MSTRARNKLIGMVSKAVSTRVTKKPGFKSIKGTEEEKEPSVEKRGALSLEDQAESSKRVKDDIDRGLCDTHEV
jgi:hypothetical protein